MKSYVIDASVIVTFLTQTQHPIHLYLPKLLHQAKTNKVKLLSIFFVDAEIANALRFSTRDHSKAKLALDSFLKFPIERKNLSSQNIQKCLELAFQNNTTVYDTMYHLLAITSGSIFLTCDQQYFTRSKQLGHIKFM